MSQREVVPLVPVEPVSDEMMRCLRVIWSAAQKDTDAFRRVLNGLERGLINELFEYHDLCATILTLQPTIQREAFTENSTRPPTSEQMSSIVHCLLSITRVVARYLSAVILRSRPDDLHAQLASLPSAVRLARGPYNRLDSYAMEVLKGLWELAVNAPDCLNAYTEGYWTPDLRGLAWALWKMNRISVLRLQDVESSPIQSLPDELLELAFSFLRTSSPRYWNAEDGPGRSLRDIASHLPARAVCKRWFKLIMELPILWAFMNLGFGPTWTKRALDLSQMEALDITVDASSTDQAMSLEVVANLARFQRIRTLSFFVPRHALEIVAHNIASSDAPVLETLKLVPTDSGSEGLQLDSTSFLGHRLLRLKAVCLSQYNITPDCPIFGAALDTLDLTCCNVWTSLDLLLTTLRTMPSLKYLRWSMSQNALHNLEVPFIFPAEAFLHSEQPLVTLSLLETLELELPIACIAGIMSNIAIPKLCILNLQDDHTFSTVGVPNEGVMSEVFQALDASLGAHLERRLTEVAGHPIEALHLREDGEAEPGRGALLLEGSSGRSHIFALGFLVADTVDGALGPATVLDILRHIFAWRVFDDAVTTVLASHEVMANDESWVTTFELLPSITTVAIEHSAPTDPSNAVGALSRTILQRANLAHRLVNITLDYLHLNTELLALLATAIEVRNRRGDLPLVLSLVCCAGLGDEEEMLLNEELQRNGGQLRVVDSRGRVLGA